MSTTWDVWCETCEEKGPSINRSASYGAQWFTLDYDKSSEQGLVDTARDQWTSFMLKHMYHHVVFLGETTTKLHLKESEELYTQMRRHRESSVESDIKNGQLIDIVNSLSDIIGECVQASGGHIVHVKDCDWTCELGSNKDDE